MQVGAWMASVGDAPPDIMQSILRDSDSRLVQDVLPAFPNCLQVILGARHFEKTLVQGQVVSDRILQGEKERRKAPAVFSGSPPRVTAGRLRPPGTETQSGDDDGKKKCHRLATQRQPSVAEPLLWEVAPGR
ncbi:hypothetical protein EYF80_002104 [Liparis tanakae]|uniref:Uncharacterized protein n=1 Tax=Liparis tanakae TaxID=230148 RepID=A0A4Z2JCN5_9TELE|nr:hypothetical protein EYF80_002104 [Liparis tanakae]